MESAQPEAVRKLDGLIEAMAEGFRAPGLQVKLDQCLAVLLPQSQDST
jgi:hypothetical protein